MIGFNGGLVGKLKTTSNALPSLPGVWTLEEQCVAKREDKWPYTGTLATGGTEATQIIGGISYRIHTFTTGGTFTVTNGGAVEYLIVAGGGGGGRGSGGGGGGGGFLAGSTTVTAQAYTITIGAGGAGATTSSNGANGGNSSALGFTATGGGA